METLWIYVGIFVGTFLNLYITVFRMILSARGEKKYNTLFNIITSLIYITVTANVANNITEDPIRMVFYAFGCGLGCYFGFDLEERIGISNDMITIIVAKKFAGQLVSTIRDKGYAVTTVDAKSSKGEDRMMLMIALRRKKEKQLLDIVYSIDENAILVNEPVNQACSYFGH